MVSGTRFLSQCVVRIGKLDAPPELMNAIAEVVVDSSLHLPSMFTLLIRDPDLKWVDSGLLDLGTPVQIAVEQAQERGGAKGTLIQGEIAALEPVFSSAGETAMRVRGYDRSHRLHRGKKTRTFCQQGDADIVRTIAQEVELTPDVDPPGVRYDYVLQHNQTNAEFLHARAARIGYQVYVADGKLCYKKGDTFRGGGPELALGDELRSFRPCWSATHQADQVVVRGWDPKAKAQIVDMRAPSERLNQGGMAASGGDVARTSFGGSAEAAVVDQPVSTAEEAKALALGLSNDIGREYVEAEGECDGDPRVQAGVRITISGVGQRFSGPYFVTSATHVYDEAGYRTTFSIAGRQPNTLDRLLGSDRAPEWAQGRVSGVVTGLVTNLNDPDDLGRVKVKYAWLGEVESDWVRLASPMAGPERGFYFMPEINDEVLIAFEHGDVHRPYVVGALWNTLDRPPEANSAVQSEGKVNQRILKSRSGHTIVLDDTDGAEQIVVCDKTEKNRIVIDSAKNTLTIEVGEGITVQCAGGDLTFDGQNVTIKAAKAFNVEARGACTIESQQAFKLNGAPINMNDGALEVM